MTTEIAALRGRLAGAEKSLELLEVGVDCDIGIIRNLADKYIDKAELKSDQLVIAARRIDEAAVKIRQLKRIVASIKNDLGEV